MNEKLHISKCPTRWIFHVWQHHHTQDNIPYAFTISLMPSVTYPDSCPQEITDLLSISLDPCLFIFSRILHMKSYMVNISFWYGILGYISVAAHVTWLRWLHGRCLQSWLWQIRLLRTLISKPSYEDLLSFFLENSLEWDNWVIWQVYV